MVNDDRDVRELARSSLFIDLRRHNFTQGPISQGVRAPLPIGLKRKVENWTLAYGFSSDWSYFSDLCVQTGVLLEWVWSDLEAVRVSEEIISDPSPLLEQQ